MKNMTNLFAGPTEKQCAEIAKRQKAETLYMQRVYENKTASLETCKAKYKELTSNL